MEPEGSLPYSQEPSTNPVHTTPSYLSKIHFSIIHPPMSWSSGDLFSSGFPTKIVYVFFYLYQQKLNSFSR
jgi:hypothetical protein